MTLPGEEPLKRWIDSIWFVRTYRVLVAAGTLVVMGVGTFIAWSVTDTREIAETAKATVTAVKDVQTLRGVVIDDALADVSDQVEDIGRDIDTIRATQLSQQGDVSTIKGILQQMQFERPARLPLAEVQ